MNPSLKVSLKLLTIFLVLILINHTLKGQSNYLKGFIIDNENDTIFGEIDYQNWNFNPKKILFKDSLNNNSIYYPDNIKEFTVNHINYISAYVDVEISPNKTDNITNNPKFEVVKKQVFLQTIIKGDKSLFYLNDSKSLFYVGSIDSLQLLLQKTYFKMVDFKRIKLTNNRYISQLIIYFSDYPQLSEIINTTNYNLDDLLNLFNKYYNLVQKKPELMNKTEKNKTDLGLILGISHTKTIFSGSEFEYLHNFNFEPSIDMCFGVYLNYYFPWRNKFWSIYNEILYSKYEFKGTYIEFENENKYNKITSEFGMGYLNLNEMIRYNYYTDKFIFFMNTGFSAGYIINSVNNKFTESKFYSSTRYDNDWMLESIRKLELGILCGIGGKYKKTAVEFRYERGDGLSPYIYLKNTTNAFYFLMSYQLN